MSTSRLWKANIEGPSGAAQVETHDMFGWQIQRHTLPAGAVLMVVALAPVQRSASPNITLHTMGRATCSVNGVPTVDRVPGLWTPERPSYAAGVVRMEAVDDIEYWCVNHAMNRRALPNLTPVRLQPGDTFTIPAGALFFHMRGALGDLQVGEHVSEVDRVLTAESASFSYIVGARR